MGATRGRRISARCFSSLVAQCRRLVQPRVGLELVDKEAGDVGTRDLRCRSLARVADLDFAAAGLSLSRSARANVQSRSLVRMASTMRRLYSNRGWRRGAELGRWPCWGDRACRWDSARRLPRRR